MQALETLDLKSVLDAELNIDWPDDSKSIFRKIWHNADEDDLERVERNSKDVDAFMRIIKTPRKFLAPITDEVGREFFVKVIVESNGRKHEKSGSYFVTKNYPGTALLLADALFGKLAGLPNITDSRAQVKLGET